MKLQKSTLFWILPFSFTRIIGNSLSSYVAHIIIDKYNFKVSKEPFERTYRVGSNLDDIHENGIHDYLKYIKFAYGRCTDHASKDIRSNIMTREKGLVLVKEMDHVLPKDLNRWLDYVQISKDEFIRIADYFRDPRVWKVKDDKWIAPLRE